MKPTEPTTAAEINIDCLRAAESLLRDHDARITAAVEELKALRRDRVVIAERVQACIDVLCGRATPDLFTSAVVPPTPAEVVEKVANPPVVPAPAPAPIPEPTPEPTPAPAPPPAPQSALLRDIPGITATDADDLDAAGLRTVADLEAKVNALGGYEWKTLNMKIYKVLLVPAGPLLGPDADRIANVVDKYMTVGGVPDATPPAKVKGGGGKRAKAVPDVKGGGNRKKAKAAG